MRRLSLRLPIILVLLCLGGLIGFGLRGLIWNPWSLTRVPDRAVWIPGDPVAIPTQWWNHFYLDNWTTLQVFELSPQDARGGYRVGAIIFNLQALIETHISYERRFCVRIGHEECGFFALASDGRELPLMPIARTTRRDPQYLDAPLH